VTSPAGTAPVSEEEWHDTCNLEEALAANSASPGAAFPLLICTHFSQPCCANHTLMDPPPPPVVVPLSPDPHLVFKFIL